MKCSLRKFLCWAAICGALCFSGMTPRSAHSQEIVKSITNQTTSSCVSNWLVRLTKKQQTEIAAAGNWLPLTHDWLEQGYPRTAKMAHDPKAKGQLKSGLNARLGEIKSPPFAKSNSPVVATPDFASALRIGWLPGERPVPLRAVNRRKPSLAASEIPLRPFSYSGFLEEIARLYAPEATLEPAVSQLNSAAEGQIQHTSAAVANVQTCSYPHYFGEFDGMAGTESHSRGEFESLGDKLVRENIADNDLAASNKATNNSVICAEQRFAAPVAESNTTVLDRNIVFPVVGDVLRIYEIIRQASKQLQEVPEVKPRTLKQELTQSREKTWECPYAGMVYLSPELEAEYTKTGVVEWARYRRQQLNSLSGFKAPRVSLLNSIESSLCGTVWHCYWYEARTAFEDAWDAQQVVAHKESKSLKTQAKDWFADSLENVGQTLCEFSATLREDSSNTEKTARKPLNLR